MIVLFVDLVLGYLNHYFFGNLYIIRIYYKQTKKTIIVYIFRLKKVNFRFSYLKFIYFYFLKLIYYITILCCTSSKCEVRIEGE